MSGSPAATVTAITVILVCTYLPGCLSETIQSHPLHVAAILLCLPAVPFLEALILSVGYGTWYTKRAQRSTFEKLCSLPAWMV